jgi:hypothetical protein
MMASELVLGFARVSFLLRMVTRLAVEAGDLLLIQ